MVPEGLGSALKPAAEFWWLCRAPLSEPTIAANVARWGTGALNIAGGRLPTTASDAAAMDRCNSPGSGRLHAREQMYSGPANGTGKLDTRQGRWPPNVAISHTLWCAPAGVRRVRGALGIRGRGGTVYGGGAGYTRDFAELGQQVGYAAPDGTETVEAWACAEGCPVAALDQQSGERRPGEFAAHQYTEPGSNGMTLGKGWHGLPERERRVLDRGGASRFMATFPADEPEVWECAEGCPVAALDAQAGERPTGAIKPYQDRNTTAMYGGGKGLHYKGGMKTSQHAASTGSASRFFYVAKSSAAERSRGLPDGERNSHPTVKPLALMKWLLTLITPPGGVVLDPFAGSGSTLVAAQQLGIAAIGIEQSAEYCAIARARLGVPA